MKKAIRSLACALALFGITTSAFALPVFKNEFNDTYAKGTDLEKTLKAGEEKATGDAKEEMAKRCYVCHFGDSKKNKNDYATALSKYLKKGNFKKERIEAEGAAVKKEIQEALKKVEGEKNAKGDTFGDLIKKGKLPGDK